MTEAMLLAHSLDGEFNLMLAALIMDKIESKQRIIQFKAETV
jgi:hypothetical protein